MVRIGLVVATALLMTAPAAAQMTGYSVDYYTGVFSTFSCPYPAPAYCYSNRTELGTIDGLIPWVTTMAPTGELVAWDRDAHELVWIDVPSLNVVSRLSVVLPYHLWSPAGLAFDQRGTLWASDGSDLYTIDTQTGDARLELQTEQFIDSIAFVGERLFGAYYYEFYEIDLPTGEATLVAQYVDPFSFHITQLAAHEGRLWSLGYEPPMPPFPSGVANWISTIDPESGEIVRQDIFGGGEFLTLALVDEPEQQPAAVPEIGRSGLIAFMLLLGLSGILVARRIV